MKVKQPVTYRRPDVQGPGLREVDKKPAQQEVKEAREVEEVKKPKVDLETSRMDRAARIEAKLLGADGVEGLNPAAVARAEYLREGLMLMEPELEMMAAQMPGMDLGAALDLQLQAMATGVSQTELREYVDTSIQSLKGMQAQGGAWGNLVGGQLAALQQVANTLDMAMVVLQQYEAMYLNTPQANRPPDSQIKPEVHAGVANLKDAAGKATEGIQDSVRGVSQQFMALADKHPDLKPQFDKLSGLIHQVEDDVAAGKDVSTLMPECLTALDAIMAGLPPDEAQQVMQSVLTVGQSQAPKKSSFSAPEASTSERVPYDQLVDQYQTHFKRLGDDFFYDLDDMKGQRQMLEQLPADANPVPDAVPEWANSFMSLPAGRKRNAAILNMAMNQNQGEARKLDKKEVSFLMHEAIRSGDVFLLNDLAYITDVREDPVKLTAGARKFLDQNPVFQKFVAYQKEVEGAE